jgi:transcriptional regulator with XRE-family HTH domain
VEFRILGPLEVVEGDRPLSLGGAKRRAVLVSREGRAGAPLRLASRATQMWLRSQRGERRPPPEARCRAGRSRAELARRAGTPRSAIGRWERGEVLPSLERLRELIRARGLEVRTALPILRQTLEEIRRLERGR